MPTKTTVMAATVAAGFMVCSANASMHMANRVIIEVRIIVVLIAVLLLIILWSPLA
jgi:hypothetical protein